MDIAIGDKLYRINTKHLRMGSEKLKMIDDSGVEWYRYPDPIREYVISEYEVVGHMIPAFTGECDIIEDEFGDPILVMKIRNMLAEFYFSDITRNDGKWHYTLAKAKREMSNLKKYDASI